jgi:hypothetical protein
MLDHDRLRQPGGITVGSQIRQRSRDLGIPAVNGVQVPVRRHRRSVTKTAHQVLDRRAGGSGQRLAGVSQVVIMPTSA